MRKIDAYHIVLLVSKYFTVLGMSSFNRKNCFPRPTLTFDSIVAIEDAVNVTADCHGA